MHTQTQFIFPTFFRSILPCISLAVTIPLLAGTFTGQPERPDFSDDKHVMELSEDWNVLLEMFVTFDGKVDYAGFKSAEPQLDAFLSRLASEVPSSNGDRNAALAYWMNAYNAFTIKMVIDHYPISSIKDLYDGKPFDHVWINLGGKEYSLNMIENDILRKQFKEPRVHFAINCAAISSPPLYDRSFKPDIVEKQLEFLAHRFINDSDYNTLSPASLQLSKIFEWYREDFGDLRDYIHRYAMIHLNEKVSISFLPYDWSLNDTSAHEE